MNSYEVDLVLGGCISDDEALGQIVNGSLYQRETLAGDPESARQTLQIFIIDRACQMALTDLFRSDVDKSS